MRQRLVGILLFCLLVSCGNKNNNNSNSEKEIPTPKTDPVPAKDLKLGRFDLLENLFQNDNWLLINNNDSSYLYSSRLGKAYFKTYHYKIVKGDSVNTVITEIKLSADTITWQLPQKSIPVYLNQIADKEAVWADKTNLDFFTFQKVDSNHIHIKYPDGTIQNMTRTITLSSFLVRSKYDYLHGTRLAFEGKK